MKYQFQPQEALDNGDVLDKWNQLSEERIENFGNFVARRLAELDGEQL
jgi:hypothetical protein